MATADANSEYSQCSHNGDDQNSYDGSHLSQDAESYCNCDYCQDPNDAGNGFTDDTSHGVDFLFGDPLLEYSLFNDPYFDIHRPTRLISHFDFDSESESQDDNDSANANCNGNGTYDRWVEAYKNYVVYWSLLWVECLRIATLEAMILEQNMGENFEHFESCSQHTLIR
jgi:hypothetical protein